MEVFEGSGEIINIRPSLEDQVQIQSPVEEAKHTSSVWNISIESVQADGRISLKFLPQQELSKTFDVNKWGRISIGFI